VWFPKVQAGACGVGGSEKRCCWDEQQPSREAQKSDQIHYVKAGQW
jgi:hypothetical protein